MRACLGEALDQFVTEVRNSFPGVLGDRARIQSSDRHWIRAAIGKLKAEETRSADTHLIKLPVSKWPGIDLYLKDESTHPTGSLKHRLARSLFLFGLCNGTINEGTTIVEASSGSTAISEAYFAELLGLPFIAVVPNGTAPRKIDEIERLGGKCVRTEPGEIYHEAERIAREYGGHYMDQFTFAERVTDWRGNNNIAERLFAQMADERFPVPRWVIVGAGTGGTSATIGRYIRYLADSYGETQLCVADPEHSVFFDAFSGEASVSPCRPSMIEGVGRPRLEPSFVPCIVDRMIRVKDAASVACTYWLSERLDRRVGGSTGLNTYAMLSLADEMARKGEDGSLVTLICDSGGRYRDTIFNADWCRETRIEPRPILERLKTLG